MTGNILEATQFRYNVYPIQHKKTFDLYKQAVACFWTVEELDFANDKSDFQKLSPQQQEFILRVLSFFAVSDALVMQNCMSFQSQVQWPEAELFFAQQSMMEAIHQETYGLMLETLSPSPERQKQLVTAWRTDGAVKAKLDWMQKWMQDGDGDDDGLKDGERFLRRVAAWLACEGILFSVSFASIFYLKKQGVGMQGLLTANEFISRDEGLHAGFGVHLMKESGLPRLGEAVVHDIFRGAVKVEKMFARESLELPLLGMNADLMCQYVDFVADYWLQACGYGTLMGDKPAVNPFDWMNMISLQGKTNFFEKRVSEYAKAGVGVAAEEQVFKMDADF